MKIVFIRHGDPNYELDALTEKGILEAKALIPRIEKINADYYYVSPLGRARQTAQIAMERIDKEAKVLDWLREFPAVVKHICEPDPGPQCWDWMPSDWAKEPSFYDIDHFYDHPVMKKGHVKEIYEDVLNHFDALLRNGIECVLLSYLINVSPMILWHGFVASTSSVTIVNTEERQKGIASFRISHFGDTSHLDASGLEPSFSARFCECYSDDTRH